MAHNIYASLYSTYLLVQYKICYDNSLQNHCYGAVEVSKIVTAGEVTTTGPAIEPVLIFTKNEVTPFINPFGNDFIVNEAVLFFTIA